MSQQEKQSARNARRSQKGHMTQAVNMFESLVTKIGEDGSAANLQLMKDAVDNLNETYERLKFKQDCYCETLTDDEYTPEEWWLSDCTAAYTDARFKASQVFSLANNGSVQATASIKVQMSRILKFTGDIRSDPTFKADYRASIEPHYTQRDALTLLR